MVKTIVKISHHVQERGELRLLPPFLVVIGGVRRRTERSLGFGIIGLKRIQRQ